MVNPITMLWPPKNKFSVEEIPDLTGEVAIVTGGNTGIGKETCAVLLSHGATVYMAARSPDKAEEAIKELKARTGKSSIHYLCLDLSDLQSVRRAAEEYMRKESTLHMLFNSAGTLLPPKDATTPTGVDLTFGTNLLGHAFFTQLLLPTLLATGAPQQAKKARVIWATSVGHHYAPRGGIVWDSLYEGAVRRKTNLWDLYYMSKWAIIVYSGELARRYGDLGIVSAAADPGIIKTELTRSLKKGLTATMLSSFQHPVEMGALTQLYAGTMPEAAGHGGKYFVPWARLGQPRADTHDSKAAERLWTWVQDQTKAV